MQRGRRWAIALATLAIFAAAAAGLLVGTFASESTLAHAAMQAAAPPVHPPHPAMPVVRFGWEGLAFAVH